MIKQTITEQILEALPVYPKDNNISKEKEEGYRECVDNLIPILDSFTERLIQTVEKLKNESTDYDLACDDIIDVLKGNVLLINK